MTKQRKRWGRVVVVKTGEHAVFPLDTGRRVPWVE